MKRAALLAALLVALGGVADARGARPADDAEKAAAAQAAGVDPACTRATISTADPSWALLVRDHAARNGGPCPPASGHIVLRHTGAGFEEVRHVTRARPRTCPVPGVPDAAAIDLGICLGPLRRTARRSFSPYSDEGERLVRVRVYRTADECSSSYISGQRGPLRCFSGNRIYDPCFPDPAGLDEALCVSSPNATDAVLLSDAPSAHDGYPMKPNPDPWAVELRDGTQCVFVSGATGGYRGRRLNYICDDRRVLWGSPRRARAVWTIRRSRTYTGRGWHRVKIRAVWK